MGAPAAPAPAARTAGSVGRYRPRRPRASPLYRLLEEHFRAFSTVYDERFAQRFGHWRPVVAEVVGLTSTVADPCTSPHYQSAAPSVAHYGPVEVLRLPVGRPPDDPTPATGGELAHLATGRLSCVCSQ